MPFRCSPREHLSLGAYVLNRLLLGAPTGIVICSALALFLCALNWASQTRFNSPWLLFFLPVAGIGVGGNLSRVRKIRQSREQLNCGSSP